MTTGASDGFKGGIHQVAVVLAGAMGLYNLGEALSERRQPRHIANAVIYAAAVIWEATNVHAHWSRT